MATHFGKKRVKLEKIPNYKNLIPIAEVNIIFNLNNDPAYKYSIANICDKMYYIKPSPTHALLTNPNSNDIKTWTSFKLKNQVLYLENRTERYEIAKIDL